MKEEVIGLLSYLPYGANVKRGQLAFVSGFLNSTTLSSSISSGHTLPLILRKPMYKP